MGVSERLTLGFALPACLLALMLSSPAQAAGQAVALKREPVSGEDIHRCLMFDEWWVAALDRNGHRFNIEILPNGRFQAVNLNGGGAVVGQWWVDLLAHQLCLRWDQAAPVSEGCYAVMRTGNLTYELLDPYTQAVSWWFVVSDEVR